jgi:hypothetical protein
MEIGPWQVLWIVCGVLTILAAALAHRGERWLYLGRAAVGFLFLIGGALFNFISIVTDGDYAGFADTAHFQWVTDSWRAVVGPNQGLFIGLLVLFEAAVGVLILSGGRRTQYGYMAVIAFYSALWLFGGFQLGWSLLMLPMMFLLLRGERRFEATPTSKVMTEEQPKVGIGA